MTLRLAVDARNLATDNQGIGRYSRAILRRLIAREDVDLTMLFFGPFTFGHRRRLRAILGSDRFAVATRPSRCDVVWHPGNGTFFSSRAPNVVSMHDAMPFVYPHPDPKRREHQQSPFLRSVRTAARFITVSRFAREEIRGVFDLPEERFEVIYHGVEPAFSPNGVGEPLPNDVPQPYFLFIGDTNQEPPKNFPLLHAAFRKAFAGVQGPVLAVVGPTDPQCDGVRYLGLASGDSSGEGDTWLRAIYRGASALCVPSYHETFGMPMLEAMACGTPVIASRATALPEIGGDAILYAEPHDEYAWSVALRQVFEDASLRVRLREAGIERARQFDWDESARRHFEIFSSVA